MKLQELRNLINEEIRKELKEDFFRIRKKNPASPSKKESPELESVPDEDGYPYFGDHDQQNPYSNVRASHGEKYDTFKDDKYYYTVISNKSRDSENSFVVTRIADKKFVARFSTKREISKIKSSPYYEAYKEIRNRWNGFNKKHGEEDMFGY